MQHKDKLDQAAISAARTHMGEFALPTVCFAVAIIVSYAAVIGLALAGTLALAVAVPLVAMQTYYAYTVVHEATHGAISGSRQSLRWVNEALGYIASWIVMVPMTVHRHEHLAHHRNTNDPESDPDYLYSRLASSPLSMLRLAPRVLWTQYQYYFRHRWGKGPRSQDIAMCVEVFAMVAPRVGVCLAGFWLEGLVLFVLAWMIGMAILIFLFAYIVHAPYQATGRYLDTCTIQVDGPLGRIVTWLWACQNYHSIHHLFPRVPFYRYRALFGEIEQIMVAKGAPIYRLGTGGMQAVGARS
jgi:beta-carotene hydroxylase